MAVINKKGEFEFNYQTPTYKTIDLIFKDGRPARANFNKLEITYTGTVRVWIENENKYVTLSQIEPNKEENLKEFTFLSAELKKISNKRKAELKQQQRQKKNR
jgi:hypothetical protein